MCFKVVIKSHSCLIGLIAVNLETTSASVLTIYLFFIFAAMFFHMSKSEIFKSLKFFIYLNPSIQASHLTHFASHLRRVLLCVTIRRRCCSMRHPNTRFSSSFSITSPQALKASDSLSMFTHTDHNV